MKNLIDYVIQHSVRESEPSKEDCKPEDKTIDVVFFDVSLANKPNADELTKLIRENAKGHYCDVNLFDGNEHGYMELGGWIGDQGLALQLMGMGALMGLWRLFTPYTLLGLPRGDRSAKQMAGMGLVTITNRIDGVAK